MITIGYSTRSSKPELQEYFKKTCGLKNVQVIEKVNPNGKSLTDVYNDILNESENDNNERMFEVMDDIVNIAYGGFNITDDDSYLRIYRKDDLEIDKNIIAQRNSWGKMFLSEDIVDELTKYFSIESREKSESLVSEYFKDRYGIIIKTFALNW